MKHIIKTNRVILITALIFLIGLASCEKNATEPPKDSPPPLPPAESMSLNFSFFNPSPGQSLPKTSISKSNFLAAAWRILVIRTTVTAAAIVPTMVFAAAISQQPVLLEDGKFHWIYTVQDSNDNFSADLAGWVDQQNSEIVWEMYISSDTHSPKLDHFLWYQGRSKISNESGWWLFHDDKTADTLVDVLKIDWQVPDDDHSSLVLTNVNQAVSDYGDSLSYRKDVFENYLMLYDASKSQNNTIFWNSNTGAGYIEWYDYKNGARSYWDENHNDIPAPPA